MRYRWDKKYLYWGVTAFCVIAASLVLVALLFRIDLVLKVLGIITNALMPVIYGLVIAFLMDPIVRFCERMFRKIRKKHLKAIEGNEVKMRRQRKRFRVYSILITLGFVFACLVGLFWLVIPEIFQSLTKMIGNFQSYLDNLNHLADRMSSGDGIMSSIGQGLNSIIGDGFGSIVELLKTNVMPQWQELLGGLTSGVMEVVGMLKNLLLGFIIAIYFLYHKERFIAHIKMFLYSFMRKHWANGLIGLGRDVNKYFGGFITGKILDSAIIGALCFVVMSIFGFEYSLLISVIVGVTNIIPFFGPFIGAIPSALLLLMVNPMQAIYFVIWVLILQQLDGNLIGPMILGNRTGVSGFWVITSIAVFGSLFGIIGIIISVPLTAVILVLVKRRVQRGLKRRKMDFDTSVYLHPGRIFEDDNNRSDDDDFYQVPIKTAELHRPPQAHEHAQTQGQLAILTKKLIKKIKEKKAQEKK